MKLKYNMYNVRQGVQKVKTRTALAFSALVLALASGGGMSLAVFGTSHAATDVIVTQADSQGWSTADTNSGGMVSFVMDSTAPGTPGNGALQLVTDGNNPSRAQYMHASDVMLGDVTELSYSTKQNSGPVHADPSYQLPVCLGGTDGGSCEGYTTLVYEPYWNDTATPVTQGVWQDWDVMAGDLWSSRDYTDAENAACTVSKGAGGPPFYSISDLQTDCPDAVVVGYGVNVGTYNTNYDVEADLFNFNGTVYNFEPTVASGEITSPTAGEHVSGTLNLAATYVDNESPNNDGVQWAVRTGTCDAVASANVFGNVTGVNDDYEWDGNNFSATLDVRNVTPGEYCFVFNPVDDPGQPNVRETQTFYIDQFYAEMKNDCKDGGWMTLHTEDDATFKNQGQCVSYVNHIDGNGADDENARAKKH